MKKYKFEGTYKGSKAVFINVSLFLIEFKDDKGVYFIHAPYLDLTGYGVNPKQAKESFDVVLEYFLDCTFKKKTLGKVLEGLGWQLKGSSKNPKSASVPSIASFFNRNDYDSDILAKYSILRTSQKEVGIPFYA